MRIRVLEVYTVGKFMEYKVNKRHDWGFSSPMLKNCKQQDNSTQECILKIQEHIERLWKQKKCLN